ncbi:MAG: sugar isomerase domain-containing protein [Verrucomicrobia bacterium]|nr:sugar isomerase domain-containing protein [Verrucomicrobiota bacterium]
MSPLADAYYHRCLEMLARAREQNAATIATLAPILGASVAGGGVIHTFGSGHSEIIAREIVGRAGGLVCISSINDPTAGFIENLVGYGTVLAERYDRQFELRPGEVVIVISNSGKNSAPLEVALHAKKKGCVVVGLCALAMSTTARTVHPEGRNLHAIADHVLDNGGLPGDAIMPLTDSIATGPTSTFIGCSLLNWLMVSTMEWLRDHGHDLPVLRSQNLPGSIERNRAVGERYRHRLSKQLA